MVKQVRAEACLDVNPRRWPMDERLGWLAKKKTHKKVPRIKVRVEREQLGRIAELCVLAYETLAPTTGRIRICRTGRIGKANERPWKRIT